MCMNKCNQYVYVCVYDMHMSMYPSPPVDVVGGREHETRDHMCIYICMYLYVLNQIDYIIV